MASTFKSATSGGVGTASGTLYTASAVTSLCVALNITNILPASSVQATVYFQKSGGSTVKLAASALLAPGEIIVISGGDQRLVLQASDSIIVLSNLASSLDVVGGFLELS